jgi:hypothetical protein
VTSVVPLAVYAEPEDHAGAFVVLASWLDGKMVTGAGVQDPRRLGIRGVGRVRGGDRLAERLGV